VSRVLGALVLALPLLVVYVALGISTHNWGGVTLAFGMAVGVAAITVVCLWAGVTLLDRRS
jgi:hypothetical protein